MERFLEGDRPGRVLSLYCEAMRLDPLEPAYPWNLSSKLYRLGLPELALAFSQRAIRVSQETGDDEWADAGAHLAMADIAAFAGQYDVALAALARAKELDPDSELVESSVQDLFPEIREKRGEPHPERALAERLLRLSS